MRASCRGVADAEDQTGKAQNHQEHVQRTQSSLVVICRYRNRGYAGQAGHQRDEQYGNQDDEDETPSDGGRHQTAEGGADSRSDGRNQGVYAHHGADALCRDFLEDDVEHQGQSDAGAQPLYGPSQQQEREDRSQRVDDQCDQEEQVGTQKEGSAAEPALESRRERGDGGDDQQVEGGHPLHTGSPDTEMAHEGREGDVHGRFHNHAVEGHDASGHYRADDPAGACLGCAHERDFFPAREESSEFRVMK